MKIIIEEKDIDENLGQVSMEIKPKKDEKYTGKDVFDLLSKALVNVVLDNDICKRHFIKLMKAYYKGLKLYREIENEEI